MFDSAAAPRPLRSSVQVEEWVLLDLFDAFNIEEGVERGCYDLRLERLRLDPAKRCEGVSFYIRLYDAASGHFAARMHYILCDSGELFIHPSCVLVDHVLLHRQGHQTRPA